MNREQLIDLYVKRYLGLEPYTGGDLLEEMEVMGIYEEVFNILEKVVKVG